MKIMKNKILLCTLAVVLPFLSGCSDYLDKRPDDQLDVETAFENSGNLERWLAYIYDGIPACYADSNWDMIADDMSTPPDWFSVGNSVSLYVRGSWTPSDPQIINYWTDLSKRIRQAYVFLENAHPLEDVPAKDIESMKAECRFFIAYYHSLLVMTYGAVPIIDKAAPSTQDEDTFLKQRPFYEVVDWCANELLDVAEDLPIHYANQADDYGRATSLWALAIRARLLTFAASPLVNGNPDLSGMVNCDGEQIFSEKYDPARWRVAAEANKLLIDTAEENGYAIYEAEDVNGEPDPYMSLLEVMMLRENQGNTEIIIPHTKDGVNTAAWFDSMAAPRSLANHGNIGVTQNLVDAFFMNNGLVPITGYTSSGAPIINEESGYSEEGFSTAAWEVDTRYFYNDPDGKEGDTKNVITTQGTYMMYCGREPRFYVSVLYNDAYHWGLTYHDNNTGTPKEYTDFYFNGDDGRPHADYPGFGYLVKKKVAPDYAGSSSTGEYAHRHGIVYRLAEAYLSYAECLYEQSMAEGTFGENENEIYKYLNKIRERAGIPQYGVDGFAKPAPENLRDLIHRERRVELCCESGIRWNDLRRWKEAEDVLDGPFFGMNLMAEKKDKEDYYKRVDLQDRKFISYWWPVPQDDIDRNPNLRQLPGW